MSAAQAQPGARESGETGDAALPGAAPLIGAGLALGAIAVFEVWAVHDGGFAPRQWLPGGLVILALVAVALLSEGVRARLRESPAAPLLLGLYTAWSYFSILWAQVRGDALDGANRTLLYLLVYLLFAALPLGERMRLAVVGVWAAAIAITGIVALGQAASAAGPTGHFVLGRLAAPITYPTANGALFLIAFLPLQAIAAERGLRSSVRPVAAAAAAVLLDLALLCESRGSLAALPLALVIYLAIARDLLRSLATLALIALAAAPAAPALFHVYSAVVDGHGYASALRAACVWVGASAAIGLAATGGLVLLERRIRISARTAWLLRRTIVAGAVAALVAAALVFVVAGHPVRTWHDFTTNEQASPQTPHLISGVGTSRYDVWRVALGEFAAHPIGGVGADNYLVPYLQKRRTAETARYPLSVELRALSETGIVGGVLFLGFLAVAIRRALRVTRRGVVPTVAVAAFAGFGYWLVHASIDWFWEFPALTAPAIAFLALAGRSPGHAERAPRGDRGVARRAILGLAPLAMVVAAASLASSWIAVRQIDEALAVAPASTARAYSLLRSAARWNPFSAQPALAEATVAANAGDRVRERQALFAALRRSGPDWYAYLMLGIVAGQEHRLAAARGYLSHAHRLSPLDPVVLYAQARLKDGAPLSEAQIGDVFRLESQTQRGVVQK
jgi:hypothetical protein